MIKVTSKINEEKCVKLGGKMFNSYCIHSKWVKNVHAKKMKYVLYDITGELFYNSRALCYNIKLRIG